MEIETDFAKRACQTAGPLNRICVTMPSYLGASNFRMHGRPLGTVPVSEKSPMLRLASAWRWRNHSLLVAKGRPILRPGRQSRLGRRYAVTEEESCDSPRLHRNSRTAIWRCTRGARCLDLRHIAGV